MMVLECISSYYFIYWDLGPIMTLVKHDIDRTASSEVQFDDSNIKSKNQQIGQSLRGRPRNILCLRNTQSFTSTPHRLFNLILIMAFVCLIRLGAGFCSRIKMIFWVLKLNEIHSIYKQFMIHICKMSAKYFQRNSAFLFRWENGRKNRRMFPGCDYLR